MIKVTFRGDKELEEFLAYAPEAITEALKKSTKKAAEAVKMEAQIIVPVRTGFLKSSIFYRVLGPMAYSVGASADYAGYVEYGTRYMMARPYLTPAFLVVQQNLDSEVADEIIAEFQKL